MTTFLPGGLRVQPLTPASALTAFLRDDVPDDYAATYDHSMSWYMSKNGVQQGGGPTLPWVDRKVLGPNDALLGLYALEMLVRTAIGNQPVPDDQLKKYFTLGRDLPLDSLWTFEGLVLARTESEFLGRLSVQKDQVALGLFNTPAVVVVS